MTQSEGGAALNISGDERREDWHCPGCNIYHGYTFRRGNITRLRVTMLSCEPEWTGDGAYTCPRCGRRVEWRAGAVALSRLLANRTGKVESSA